MRHQMCMNNTCKTRECSDDLREAGYLKLPGGRGVGAEGEFHCPPGYVYHEEEEVSQSVTVVCEMQLPDPKWVTQDTMRILKPCKRGTKKQSN